MRIRIRIYSVLKNHPNTNTNTIRFEKSSEYEYEYHYLVSTIRILFEYRIIRSPLFRYLNSIIKCWQEKSGSTGIYFLFLHIYCRYYMISPNELFGHGRIQTKSMQRLIAKKGPIDQFALMCAGPNSRSY